LEKRKASAHIVKDANRKKEKERRTNVCELPNDLPCSTFVESVNRELEGEVGLGAKLSLDEELVVLLPCVDKVDDVRVRLRRGERTKNVDFFEMTESV
jgi:hypothetical protein